MPGRGGMIWLASYPKSGNTWLRLLLANLLAPDDGPVDINRMGLDSRAMVARHVIEDVVPIDTGLLTLDEIERLRPRVCEAVGASATGTTFAKCHDPYRRNAAGEPILGRGAAAAALYVVRDPRDVAVSLAHHNGTSVGEAIRDLCSEHCLLASETRGLQDHVPQRLLGWSAHVASWLDQTDLPVHAMRYEDLLADPVASFAAAVDFLGLPATTAAVERAVRNADFAELQRQEGRAGFNERQSRSTAPFFRSGRAGAWTEALAPAEVETIVAAHGAVMRRMGYV